MSSGLVATACHAASSTSTGGTSSNRGASALALLARVPEADAEARMAYEATMRARHRYRTCETAEAAAAQAAQ
ncbi:hypothetical protein ACH4FX_42640 [Streptomyces sp. NPDC018019]|uniref:hypothetical protein n=1 Tax=Streptomyces sp. NPDC018019 TaxID=3365030 RepID=UPI003791E7B6